jgi:hypothetical protein
MVPVVYGRRFPMGDPPSVYGAARAARHCRRIYLGEDFIGSDSVCLILGDNIFYHPNMENILAEAKDKLNGAVVFGIRVSDPRTSALLNLITPAKSFHWKKNLKIQSRIISFPDCISTITMLLKSQKH